MRRLQDLQLRMNVTKLLKESLKGHNIARIAKNANISRATIYNLLNGDRVPNALTINKIHEALDIEQYNNK